MALRKVGAPVPGARQPTSKKVLYVEDEDLNWEVTSLSLGKSYDVVRARNAREAIDLIRKVQFDLVLMDIQLAGSELDGIQLTQILTGKKTSKVPEWAKGVPPQRVPPIVFVTAYAARYSPEELQKAGGTDMVTKPVDFARLLITITKLVLKGEVRGREWV